MGNNEKQADEVVEIRRYSEALKMSVVSEIESGRLNVREAMRFYDITWRKTINRWQQKYGKDRKKTRVVRVVMKSEHERIQALEKALADKELELLASRTVASLYEEVYGEDVKKKLSPARLAKLEQLRKEAKLR
jgi:transposase-like protein